MKKTVRKFDMIKLPKRRNPSAKQLVSKLKSGISSIGKSLHRGAEKTSVFLDLQKFKNQLKELRAEEEEFEQWAYVFNIPKSTFGNYKAWEDLQFEFSDTIEDIERFEDKLKRVNPKKKDARNAKQMLIDLCKKNYRQIGLSADFMNLAYDLGRGYVLNENDDNSWSLIKNTGFFDEDTDLPIYDVIETKNAKYWLDKLTEKKLPNPRKKTKAIRSKR
jgi:hypothetical protein